MEVGSETHPVTYLMTVGDFLYLNRAAVTWSWPVTSI